MSNKVVRVILETRLKAWADAQVPKVPIAFEGTPFSKPAASAYLEPVLIPNVTINNELSGQRKTHLGMFEVRCWYPSGRGMGGVEQLANNVINLFPILPKTGSVSIENTPYAEQSPIDDAGWIIVPVIILYRYEAA